MRKLIIVSLFMLACTLSSYAIKNNTVKLGIDILIENNFEIIKNKNVALLANFSSRTRNGDQTAEIMASSPRFKLKTIFTPEHGYYSIIPAGVHVSDNEVFGVKSISLYGDKRKPTPDMLKDIDVIVIDIQDIGIRSYTYISTMYNILEAAAENDVDILICDRPNPLSGDLVDGNVLKVANRSFIGIAPIPYIHGCTIGELVNIFVGEKYFNQAENLRYEVLKMRNWRRDQPWEKTGLAWYPTSPNIPTVNAVRGAAMLGVFGELRIFNIGIGTTLPFQYCYFTNPNLIINNEIFDFDENGIVISKIHNTKISEKPGILFNFDSDYSPRLYSFGFKILAKLLEKKPDFITKTKLEKRDSEMFIKAVGNSAIFDEVTNFKSSETLMELVNEGLVQFLNMRLKYLLY